MPHTNLKRLSIHTVVIYREIKRNSESSYHLLGCVKTLRQRNTHYVVKVTGKAILEGSDFGCTRNINKTLWTEYVAYTGEMKGIWWGKLKEGGDLESASVNGRTLNWIFKK